MLRGEPVKIVVFEGRDDEPWFKAKPVHNFLGCHSITHTLARVDDEDKASLKDLAQRYGPPRRGGVSGEPPPNPEDYNEGKAIYVNESGLYAMALKSKKPEAKPFQHWVTREVLPSIRKTGSYVSSGTLRRKRSVDVSKEKHKLKKKRRRAESLEDASELLKDIVVRTTNLSGKDLKLRLIRVSAVFAELVMREHEALSPTELERRYGLNSAFGTRVRVPCAELGLALSSVEMTEESSSRHMPLGPSDSSSCLPRGAHLKRSKFCVKTEGHHRAKDDANELWIRFLPRSKVDACFFILDAFREEQGFVLRTTSALLAHGFHPRQLYSANSDKGIFLALCEAGVNCFEGTWHETSWYQTPSFDGIYLDLCTGSAGYVSQQLELATIRAATGCVMAWTLTERDFDGEDIVLRVARLEDMLRARMWTPAAEGGSMRESLLVHKCGISRQRVVTQLWRYCGR